MESLTESLGRIKVASTASKFTVHSSIACPFLVISEEQLVQSIPAPTAAEFAELTSTAMGASQPKQPQPVLRPRRPALPHQSH